MARDSAERATSDPRRLACDVLLAVEKGQFSDTTLARHLVRARLDPRDQALATRLVYGTLVWQAYLDHLIAACGQTPARLDPPIRTLLRVALFQLTKLERVPAFAVVDTAVELSKGFRRGVASGLVNAVLRRFLRESPAIALPPADRDDAADLALRFSHPAWLVGRWLQELGVVETRALLAANNQVAPTVLRVNRLRTSREHVLVALERHGVAARPSHWAPDGIVLESGGDPGALPGYGEGLFSAQGEASQLVTLLTGAEPGQRVWDACAAPGGKTAHLAAQLQDRGAVDATDVNERGLHQLRASVARLGLTCVRPVHADAGAGGERGPYDVVLVDAPCSGFGTLRQHPEIRWRRAPTDVDDLATRQGQLLAAVAPSVRPGGALVYATCTIMRAENEGVIEPFLAGHLDFTIEEAPASWPLSARDLVDDRGFLRTFPHRDGLDGFFAARLRRTR